MNFKLNANKSKFFTGDSTNQHYQWETYLYGKLIDSTGYGIYSQSVQYLSNGSTYGELILGQDGQDFINYLLLKHTGYQFLKGQTLQIKLRVRDSINQEDLSETIHYLPIKFDIIPPIPIISKVNNILSFEDSVFYDDNVQRGRQYRWRIIYNSSFVFNSGWGQKDSIIEEFYNTSFELFNLGENTENLASFFYDELNIPLEINESVVIALDCIDSNCIESTIEDRITVENLTELKDLWVESTYKEYLLIHQHEDEFGNDVAGRELTASQKQYIQNRIEDTLAPRFFGSSASIVPRTYQQMAQSFYYWAVDSSKSIQSTTFKFGANGYNFGWEYGGTTYTSDAFIEGVSGSSNTMCWDVTTSTSYFENVSANQEFSAGGSYFDSPCPIVKWGNEPTIIQFVNPNVGFSGFTGKFVSKHEWNSAWIASNANLTQIDISNLINANGNFLFNNNNFSTTEIEKIFDKIYDYVVTQGIGATGQTFNVSGNLGASGFASSRATEIATITSSPYNWNVTT